MSDVFPILIPGMMELIERDNIVFQTEQGRGCHDVFKKLLKIIEKKKKLTMRPYKANSCQNHQFIHDGHLTKN